MLRQERWVLRWGGPMLLLLVMLVLVLLVQVMMTVQLLQQQQHLRQGLAESVTSVRLWRLSSWQLS